MVVVLPQCITICRACFYNHMSSLRLEICLQPMKINRTILNLIPTLTIAILLFSCNGSSDNTVENSSRNKAIPTIDYTYIKSHPHDTTAFTEGFVIHQGKLYESTGATKDLPQTRSLFGIVDLTTGEIDTKVELDKLKYFGEGITFLNGQVFQLTYKTKIGFVYNAVTFKKVKEFSFQVRKVGV
jgi:glutamine cyclotransferase